MRLAWRLARREVRRRPGRTVLVVLLVAITVAGITVADLAYRSRELPGDSELGRAAAKLMATASDGDTSDPFDVMRPSVAKDAETAQGYEVFGLPVRRADRPGLGMSATLFTVDTRTPLLDGLVRLQRGRLPAADTEVAVGPALARVLQLDVGDTLRLSRPEIDLTIVGVATSPVDTEALFIAPGYPVDEVRVSSRIAVLYTSALARRTNFAPDIPVDVTGSPGITVGFATPPQGQPADAGELLIGWVVMALILGVLGIVVAAAFAASGRRQLVTLGQLGATGADERFARRFLALQGSVTGVLGALVGVAVGTVTAVSIGRPVLRRGELNLVWFDLGVIVVTTVVVATFAALVPTRRLAKAPILTALAGRAPVAQVRALQVRLGAVSIAIGLLVMSLSVASVRGRDGGAGTLEIVIAVLGAAAVLGGVCALSPTVVDRWGSVGGRTSGSTRLAVRSIVRHRARSAAMVAAIAAVGAVGVAGASGVERWRQLDVPADVVRADVITVGTFGIPQPVDSDPEAVAAALELRSQVDQVVGGVRWTELARVGDRALTSEYIVATDAALKALEIPKDAIRFDAQGTATAARTGIDFHETYGIPGMALGYAMLIEPKAAADPQWLETSPLGLGHVDHDLTRAETDQLLVLSYASSIDGYIFGDPVPQYGYIGGLSWETAQRPPAISRDELRWIVIAALLLLFSLIVGTGLALWAAEGKVERDQLVAVGAAPRSLAGMAGIRALVLSVTGGVMAVPLGMVTLWVVLHAAGKDSPFPTLTAAMVAVGLPVVIAVGAFGVSAVAQRLRPATASTMSLD